MAFIWLIATVLWLIATALWANAYRTTGEPLILAVAALNLAAAAANGYVTYLYFTA